MIQHNPLELLKHSHFELTIINKSFTETGVIYIQLYIIKITNFIHYIIYAYKVFANKE